jgi:hypothetical protein
LAADNDYTGVTLITGGSLQIGDGGTARSAGAGEVTANAADGGSQLIFDFSGPTTFSEPTT